MYSFQKPRRGVAWLASSARTKSGSTRSRHNSVSSGLTARRPSTTSSLLCVTRLIWPLYSSYTASCCFCCSASTSTICAYSE